MNTYTNATTSTPTLKGILAVMADFERDEEIRKTIELATKEGVVYVGPGVDSVDLGRLLTGVEVRKMPYMESGQIMAIDTKCFRELNLGFTDRLLNVASAPPPATLPNETPAPQ